MPASRAQQADTADRRAKCLAMRLAGANWDHIATRLGYASKAAACKDFDRAMKATQAVTAETATRLREIERLRLDRLQSAFWTGAMAGDTKAGRLCLDIHQARVRLEGLDAAQRTIDNAVDAWLNAIGGPTDGGLSAADAAALADVG